MSQAVPLDDTDRKILGILAKEGRISTVALARRVNLTPTPCAHRVRRLEEAGLITGYRAVLSPQKLGLGVCAFVQVKLERNTREQAEAFEQALTDIAQVSEFFSTAGTHDYMLKIYARDLGAYQRIIKERIATLPFIDDVQSTIILAEHNDGGLQTLEHFPKSGNRFSDKKCVKTIG